MDEWDLYRVVFMPQPDRATQERVQVAFMDEARRLDATFAHERTYERDGKWQADTFIVCTAPVAARLFGWKEVKRIRAAK